MVLGSEVVTKTSSVKSGTTGAAELETGGVRTFEGAMVFIRYTTFRPDGGPERERSWDFLVS